MSFWSEDFKDEISKKAQDGLKIAAFIAPAVLLFGIVIALCK